MFSIELPPSHSELLSMVKGHAALGGGGLALFGSGCLYTWPKKLDEVQKRFRDRTEVDWLHYMDDSAFRYEQRYSSSLSQVFGEFPPLLGHYCSTLLPKQTLATFSYNCNKTLRQSG